MQDLNLTDKQKRLKIKNGEIRTSLDGFNILMDPNGTSIQQFGFSSSLGFAEEMGVIEDANENQRVVPGHVVDFATALEDFYCDRCDKCTEMYFKSEPCCGQTPVTDPDVNGVQFGAHIARVS